MPSPLGLKGKNGFCCCTGAQGGGRDSFPARTCGYTQQQLTERSSYAAFLNSFICLINTCLFVVALDVRHKMQRKGRGHTIAIFPNHMIRSMAFLRVQSTDSLWESPHPISLKRDTKHQDTQAQVLRPKGEQHSLVGTVQRSKGAQSLCLKPRKQA